MTGGRRKPKPAGLGYRPGIDGLRGLAVIAVLLFHAEFGWAGGGFLGVSVFFTLSGFLIGTLVLTEHATTGRIDFGNFWDRRARRLLPAALAALLGVVVLVATRLPAARASLVGDVLAALGYVANWRFWATGQSYSALFTTPSPLLHFWSLAIEEQFYVVFPLLALLATRLKQGWLVVFGGLWVAGVVSALIVASGGRQSLGYYATFTRMPELLTGVLLAWATRRVVGTKRHTPGAVDLAGWGALGALAVLVATTERTSGWLYHGGFALVSALSALAVLAVAGDGSVANAIGWKPLRNIGKVSYGLYLYHWPVYLWLNEARVHESRVVLTALRWLITAGLAVASYRWLEQPIRLGKRLARRRALAPAFVVALATALIAIPVSRGSTASAAKVDFEKLQTKLQTGLTTTTIPAAAATTTTTGLAPGVAGPVLPTAGPTTVPYAGRVRVGVFGDSTSLVIADGLRERGEVLAGSASAIGCTVMQAGEIDFLVERRPVSRRCEWASRWPEFLTTSNIDIAVIGYGGWDLAERWINGEPSSRHIGDPVIDRMIKTDMLGAADLLLATGKPVAWLTMPLVEFGKGETPQKAYAMNDPQRVARWNALLNEVAKERPKLRLIDYAGYLDSLPGGQRDGPRRPDGVHLTIPAAFDVAGWLSPVLIKLASE
jgi:peptidoglycan/LPS O-acetylase OafA/YrhL